MFLLPVNTAMFIAEFWWVACRIEMCNMPAHFELLVGLQKRMVPSWVGGTAKRLSLGFRQDGVRVWSRRKWEVCLKKVEWNPSPPTWRPLLEHYVSFAFGKSKEKNQGLVVINANMTALASQREIWWVTESKDSLLKVSSFLQVLNEKKGMCVMV